MKITKLLFLTQGIYLPLLRIAEPFFFAVFKRNVRFLCSVIFCCKKPVDQDNEIDEASLDRHLFTEQELDEEAEQYQMYRQTRLLEMGHINEEELEAINANSNYMEIVETQENDESYLSGRVGSEFDDSLNTT